MLVTVLRNPASQSGRRLSQLLNCGLGTVNSIKFCRTHRYVINWGVGAFPLHWTQTSGEYSNQPEAVRNCADKISTFVKLSRAQVPHVEAVYARGNELADNGQFDELFYETAEKWLEEDGKFIARTTVTGHSGQGLIVVRRGHDIPEAPLFTRYFKKNAEYRVHVAFGRVILTQQKKRMNEDRRDAANAEAALVRTHANGWVFAVNDLHCDVRGYRDRLHDLAIRACNAVGAGHCAVDILVRHDQANTMVVCEINSAPAIRAGSTEEAYVAAFQQAIAQARAR